MGTGVGPGVGAGVGPGVGGIVGRLVGDSVGSLVGGLVLCIRYNRPPNTRRQEREENQHNIQNTHRDPYFTIKFMQLSIFVNLPAGIITVEQIGILQVPSLRTQRKVHHDLFDLFDLLGRHCGLGLTVVIGRVGRRGLIIKGGGPFAKNGLVLL